MSEVRSPSLHTTFLLDASTKIPLNPYETSVRGCPASASSLALPWQRPQRDVREFRLSAPQTPSTGKSLNKSTQPSRNFCPLKHNKNTGEGFQKSNMFPFIPGLGKTQWDCWQNLLLTTGNEELVRNMWQLLLTLSLPILTTPSLWKAHGKHQGRQHLQMRHLSDFFLLFSEHTNHSENQMHLYAVVTTPAASAKTFYGFVAEPGTEEL